MKLAEPRQRVPVGRVAAVVAAQQLLARARAAGPGALKEEVAAPGCRLAAEGELGVDERAGVDVVAGAGAGLGAAGEELAEEVGAFPDDQAVAEHTPRHNLHTDALVGIAVDNPEVQRI